MNKKNATVFSTAMLSAGMVLGQGTFQNLGFEQARIIFIPSTAYVATTNALLGWTAFYQGNEMTGIHYNAPSAINPVGLVGSSAAVISGSYSVILETDGEIRQTGAVPADANSLFFKARWAGMSPVLAVALGGQSLTLTVISNTNDYTLFGVDVSRFSGQVATLSCSQQGLARYVLDDFEFSPLLIPEPGVFGLVGVGVLCFAVRWVHRRAKRGG